REARVVGLCPAHIEQIVASFEKAVLTHTLFECIDEYRARRCKAATQNSDHRHRRRLRAPRPGGHRATEQRGQEFSPCDVACHVTLRLGVIHAMDGLYHTSIARSVTKAGTQVE